MNSFIPKLVGSTFNALSHLSSRYAGARALDLFRMPLAGKLSEEDLTFLSTAKHEIIECERYPVQAYLWEGSGPKVMLLHGWESNSARWQPLIERLLNKNCSVMALDAPAHGASGAKLFSVSLYASFLEAACQKWSPEVLVGHSLGGQTIAYYLNRYLNQAIDKAALLGTPSELSTIVEKYNRMLNLNQKVKDGFAQNFQKIFGFSANDFSVKKFAENFKIPALVVHDEEDDIAPFSDGINIAREWENAKFWATKGLGHSLQGEIVDNKVIDFILKK